MKYKAISDGALALIIMAGSLVSSTMAAHAHRHNDILDRIMHKSSPSSNRGMAMTNTVYETTALTTPQASVTSPHVCVGVKCDIEGAAPFHRVASPVTPAADVDRLPTVSSVPNDAEDDVKQRGHRLRFGSDHSTVSLPTFRPHIRQAESSSTSDSLADAADPSTTPDSDYGPTFYASLYPSSSTLDPEITAGLLVPRQDDSYQSFVLGPFPLPTSSTTAATPVASSVCPSLNNTTYTSTAAVQYRIACNIDFTSDDLSFELVSSFGACVQKCDDYNNDRHQVLCLASLFVPSREAGANDCYLKSSVSHQVQSTLPIEGALRISGIGSVSSSPSGSVAPTVPANDTALSTGSANSSLTKTSASAVSSTSKAASTAGVTYASGNKVLVPRVAGFHLHGPSQNTPSKQYIEYSSPPGVKLATSLLQTGVNGDLTSGYDISLQTGVLEVNITTQSRLSPLAEVPHLSRDGGRGGLVNGQHLFVFCDTGSYTTTTTTANGNFLGFVSSSVAIDTGMNGLSGTPLNLQDGVGEWSDNSGRQRGFAPLTQGEQAYNQAMQGNGQRYAVWPESSIIPLDASSGILYAPVVYDNVNRATNAAIFTYTGTTLLRITAGGKGGPVAQRAPARMFNQDEIEWGCAGGIRSWGQSGIGGEDGYVYIFGNIAGGILAARASPTNVGNRDQFEYWDGTSFSSQMLTSSSTAFFIKGAFMDVDIFYSPRHLTFIIVYITVYADSTFYYRYLEADQAILPPFAPGSKDSSDYVENIFKYQWSDEQVLYKAARGMSGKYIYAGGVHQGYYGSNDITNGGSRMLLSWTAPTGLDPSSYTSEYQIITAEIDWV